MTEPTIAPVEPPVPPTAQPAPEGSKPVLAGNSIPAEPTSMPAPVEDSSYRKLKAAHDYAQTELRKTQSELEALKATPDDRLAALEVELARTKAVARYGLTEEDAAILKGTPEQILEDAAYWAGKIKTQPQPNSDIPATPAVDNKPAIDAQFAGAVKPAPTPKSGDVSWNRKYEMATPAERDRMFADVQAGRVDPRK